MQVAPSGGQICNKCKWCHLVAKFGTNASCVWWPSLELMQVEPPLAGEITQVLDAIPWVRCASSNVLQFGQSVQLVSRQDIIYLLLAVVLYKVEDGLDGVGSLLDDRRVQDIVPLTPGRLQQQLITSHRNQDHP